MLESVAVWGGGGGGGGSGNALRGFLPIGLDVFTGVVKMKSCCNFR